MLFMTTQLVWDLHIALHIVLLPAYDPLNQDMMVSKKFVEAYVPSGL